MDSKLFRPVATVTGMVCAGLMFAVLVGMIVFLFAFKLGDMMLRDPNAPIRIEVSGEVELTTRTGENIVITLTTDDSQLPTLNLGGEITTIQSTVP